MSEQLTLDAFDTDAFAGVHEEAESTRGWRGPAACDIVVAARNATFTCSFNRIGLVADLGAAWTLPRRIGAGQAKLLMFRGKPLPAAEAATPWRSG